ncbi:MAG: xylulose kinase [Propionibacteriaceae bacterium]|jgi:FGGY-family pentulose kinase|nr:xylulose kinase [Propionibacteriaceae bacterium]
MGIKNQSTGPFLLGIDGGTEAVRAAVFTPEGELVGLARAAHPTQHPHPGWAEGNPNDWWNALVSCVRQVLTELEITGHDIAGISCACTSSTVVFCDNDGTPARPALLWMDIRSSTQAKQIAATAHPSLKYTGFGAVSAEWLPCKALWVHDNDLQTFANSPVVCEYTDWFGFKLTGTWTASINTAAIRGFYDRNEGGWPVSLFEQIGLDDLVEKLPSTVLDMGTPLGEGLCPEAAAELGLEAGTPVGVGGADAFVAQIGMNAIRPGSVALITGNSHLQILQSDTPSYGGGLFGAYTDAVMPGQYTVEGGQPSSGSVLRWVRDLISGSTMRSDAENQAIYHRLETEAARLPPGADGVHVLEHWQGSRTPHVDSESRGAIWGLTLAHGAPHLYRAVVEAVCFGTESIFEALRDSGHTIHEIVACGGALKSPLWIQTHADVSNHAIAIPKVGESGTLGSAILASVAAGIHPDVATGAAKMTSIERLVEPREGACDQYKPYMEQYRDSYYRLRELSRSGR